MDFGVRERQNLEPVEAATGPDLDLAVRDALAVYYFPGMWDWPRPVVLPLVLQGFARSVGRQSGAGGQAAAEAMLRRSFDWAPGVDRFSPVRVECAFEVTSPTRPAEAGSWSWTTAARSVTSGGSTCWPATRTTATGS